jgi:hypothetical protein
LKPTTVLGRRYGRATTIGLAAIFAAGGALVTPGAAQAAVSCGSQAVTNADDGYIVLGEDANLQKAPYAACGTNIRATAGTKIWSWCVAENDYENDWLWGRIDGTQTYGWVFLDHASEVVIKPTRDEGFCPGEAPASDAVIDGADHVVIEPTVPDADDALPVQEYDASTDEDPTLAPLPGAMDVDDDPSADAEEGEDVDDTTGQATISGLATVSAASATSVKYGAPITRAKVIARAANWVKRKVPYDAKHGNTRWDVNKGKKYRPDCQGMVDMAWALKGVPSTREIGPYIKRTNWSKLQPGDELLKRSGGNHAMLFEKWANRKHTRLTLMEEPKPGDHAKRITLSLSYVKGHSFLPYMYKKIR